MDVSRVPGDAKKQSIPLYVQYFVDIEIEYRWIIKGTIKIINKIYIIFL